MRNMLDDWRQRLDRRPRGPEPARSFAWLTGRLAAPALQAMADELHAHVGWRPMVIVVDNAFFGEDVTVSGLLSGADLIRALRALRADVEDVVLPRGAFGFDGRRTLDGISAEEVGDAHPGRVHLASSPAELLDLLSRPARRSVLGATQDEVAERDRLVHTDQGAPKELEDRQEGGDDFVHGLTGHGPERQARVRP